MPSEILSLTPAIVRRKRVSDVINKKTALVPIFILCHSKSLYPNPVCFVPTLNSTSFLLFNQLSLYVTKVAEQ